MQCVRGVQMDSPAALSLHYLVHPSIAGVFFVRPPRPTPDSSHTPTSHTPQEAHVRYDDPRSAGANHLRGVAHALPKRSLAGVVGVGGIRRDHMALRRCAKPSAGLALKGYDLVQYHSLPPESNSVKGSSDFTAQFNGYTFAFASQQNRDRFMANPK